MAGVEGGGGGLSQASLGGQTPQKAACVPLHPSPVGAWSAGGREGARAVQCTVPGKEAPQCGKQPQTVIPVFCFCTVPSRWVVTAQDAAPTGGVGQTAREDPSSGLLHDL